MLRNYLKIAWRNLLRNKVFSSINVVGLSVGMACCMLLLLYIRSELSFDQHHRNANQLYLVDSEAIKTNGNREEYGLLGAAYAGALKLEFPEVVQVSRLFVNVFEDKTLLQARESGKSVRSFYETKGYQVDSTFFDLFTYQFVEGDTRTVLRDPNGVVLSQTVARNLFGDGPVLNKIVRVGGTSGNGEDFKVTGVYRDESPRSHIDAHFFMPISAGLVGQLLRGQPQNFASNNIFYTYVRLRPDADARRLERKLPAFMEKYARKDLNLAGFDKRLSLVPVPRLHLHSQLQSVVSPTSSMMYLYILGSIALFTLLIAGINFINLATARSAKRATEVGIRKVLGAGRGALIRQFIGESLILTGLALLTAVGLVIFLLPQFNQLTDKTLQAFDLLSLPVIPAFLGLALLTGLIAGSYPAFFLSMYNPVQVLKGGATHGKFGNTWSAVTLRRGLVVFQFVVSISLVLASLIIGEQMQFLLDKPLGFTQEQQLAIPFRSNESRAAYDAYRNKIVHNNQVTSAAGTTYYPGINHPEEMSLYRPDQSVDQIQGVKINRVDFDYFQTMGFGLTTGRLFSRQFPGDTSNRMVVNEVTLRKFSIPVEKAVGQRLNFDWQGQTHPFEIVGVVKDFHFESLHQAIQPYAFLLNNRPSFNYIIVHVNTTNSAAMLGFLEKTWKSVSPNEPFEYSFLDNDFQKNYNAEVRTSRIVSTFTIISILISCLGLFGLAAFDAQQRTKEIGVRKVLGASVASIVTLLSKDFLKLVLIAIVIASPIAWYTMNRWLQDFAYKIDIEWWVFGVAGFLAVSIALLTVSFQSVKAALTNPVNSLRSE